MPGAGAEAFGDEVEGGEAAIVAFVVFGNEGGNFIRELCRIDTEAADAAIDIDDG